MVIALALLQMAVRADQRALRDTVPDQREAGLGRRLRNDLHPHLVPATAEPAAGIFEVLGPRLSPRRRLAWRLCSHCVSTAVSSPSTIPMKAYGSSHRI